MFYVLSLKKVKRFIYVCIFIGIVFFVGLKALEKLFPVKYMENINKYSEEYGLSPSFVCAVINVESKFRLMAESPKGAKGLMQLMDTTANWGATEIWGAKKDSHYDQATVYKADVNIQIGCWYLNRLLNQFDDNKALVAAAYNAGSGNVSKWLSDKNYSNDGKSLDYIPFSETRNYVKKVYYNEKIYDVIFYIKSKWGLN